MDESMQVLNAERVQALEKWLKATNIKLTQVNGQRKYGAPPEGWSAPPPGAHCEVFISQIPRDAFEDLLIPLFSSVGPLWEFRLMMNFSGQNRGFAYAKYGSADVAHSAIRKLHGYELEPGFCLRVCRSTEKRHLCIEPLPAATKQELLFQNLCLMAEGVERVSLRSGPGMKNQVSAVIGFTSHYAASMAKKVLVEGFKKNFCLDIVVKWHQAEKPSLRAPPSPEEAALPSCFIMLGHSSAQPRLPAPHHSAGYCRAVGGPSTHHLLLRRFPSTQRHGKCADVGQLHPKALCRQAGGFNGFN